MSDHVRDAPLSSDRRALQSFHYPFASSPDIIRSHQKDAYFQSHLLLQLQSILRSFYGTRTVHNWENEARTFTELLYLSLTTFLGNRTLGEEYTDIVQIHASTHRLPSIARRSAYILSAVLLPYGLTRVLPSFRRRLRAKLEAVLHQQDSKRSTTAHQLSTYILEHLDTLTSPSLLSALVLATFYFTGAYYTLSKRLFNLRYIFTRKIEPSSQRAGYEVLGVLLAAQLLVQGYLHVQTVYTANSAVPVTPQAGSAVIDGGVEIGTMPDANLLAPIPAPSSSDPVAQKKHLAHITSTPYHPEPVVDLEDAEQLQYISGKQSRKCTLCLEPMKDPFVTTCGHVFCWTCVTEWLREQPMCPLCRQGTGVQHVLPLRG
nr:hypothetical protein B0A51_07031 [Rachicladosporium sp. CCFEE 5018]